MCLVGDRTQTFQDLEQVYLKHQKAFDLSLQIKAEDVTIYKKGYVLPFFLAVISLTLSPPCQVRCSGFYRFLFTSVTLNQ
jgi:hypothetical protein